MSEKSYSPEDLQTATPSELLAAMRRGSAQSLHIKFGNLKMPVRLLTAIEEADVLNKARLNAIEKAGPTADEATVQTYKSRYVMQSILFRATSIKGDVGFTTADLNDMSSEELAYLYDQYVSACRVIDVEFEQLSPEQIRNIVMSVKKKTATVSEYFTWQLAEVGRFFLKEIVPILPEDSELGS